MKKLGLILIAIALLLPLIWFVPLAGKHDPIAVMSQYLGVAALVGMGIVQFLATRTRLSEVMFGPLDKNYVLHKWLAVGAVGAAALHDIIDADIDGLGRETALVKLAETMGEIGYNGLLLLVFATIIPFIPYHYWRLSHKFIGLFFALSAFHFAFILKPFGLGDAAGIYTLGFCFLGIFSYLYMLIAYARVPAAARYRVSEIVRHGDISEVTLTPEGRGIRHKPGQFAFIGFDAPMPTEVHPFTISGAPDDARTLRFAIKALGGYTHDLQHLLKVGAMANVKGPHGGFLRPDGARQQVWIGAGVGVTPFLAWARSLDGPLAGPATFYYCVRDGSAPFVEELRIIAARIDHLRLEIVTSQDGRLTPSRIVADHEGALAGADVFFCGPSPMADALKEGLSGVRFHTEAFEIRSGIGIRAIAEWVWIRLEPRVNKRLQMRRP